MDELTDWTNGHYWGWQDHEGRVQLSLHSQLELARANMSLLGDKVDQCEAE